MGEWRKVCISEIADINKNTYSSKEKWTYVNYLDTGNIVANKVDSIQYIDLVKDKLPSRARRKVSHNSIIYSTVRPNQLHYGIIKEQPENFLVSTGFAVIDVKAEAADADYIYYILTQNEIIEHLQAIGEQSVSAYPAIRALDIGNLEIILPELEEQKKIARMLRMLDEKIDINNKINGNLPPHPHIVRIAAVRRRRRMPKRDVCLHTDNKAFGRGGNEKTAEPFSSLRVA